MIETVPGDQGEELGKPNWRKRGPRYVASFGSCSPVIVTGTPVCCRI